MGETIDKPMSVTEARRRLQNTRALSSEQVEQAQRAVSAFYASKPRKQCVACSSMIWSEHTADGEAVWCCDRCHRSPDLTAEEWRAAEADRQQAAEARLRAADAAVVPPRDRLREALAKRAEANAIIERLERAVPAARSAVTEAQERHDRATAAAEAVNATASENLATAFFEGTKPTDATRVAAAARGELAAAVDALITTKNARTIIDSKIKDARTAMGYANDRARKAAHSVLVAERLENLLADVAQARATYLESAGQLGWLIKTHVIPDSDRRAHQFLGEANQPPSTWREAATAGTAAMEDALEALLNQERS
jgi:hypothetical protein